MPLAFLVAHEDKREAKMNLRKTLNSAELAARSWMTMLELRFCVTALPFRSKASLSQEHGILSNWWNERCGLGVHCQVRHAPCLPYTGPRGEVVEQYDNGISPEDMVRAYDTLELADVHAVIAYYLRHRDDVAAYLKRRAQEAETLRAKIEAERPRLRGRSCWHAAVSGRRTMLRLASDADVHGDIIRGLRRRLPNIDLARAQDALPEGTPDREILAWAAHENRVLDSITELTRMQRFLLFLLALPAQAQDAAPQFIVHTAEASLPPAPLTSLAEDWSVRVGGPQPRLVNGPDLVSLRRAGTLLPPFPSRNFVLLTSGDIIPVEPGTVRLDDERLHFRPGCRLRAGKNAEMSVPLSYLCYLCLATPEGTDDPDLFLARLAKAKRPHDVAFLKNGDRIEGKLLALNPSGSLTIKSSGRDVQLAPGRLALLALSTEFQAQPRTKKPHGHVVLAGGGRIQCRHLRLDPQGNLLEGKALFGADVEIPLDQVAAMSVYQGRAAYLSDLAPKAYEHTPFLGLSWPLASDCGVTGKQLSLAGNRFDKGLAMHSRSRVTYQLHAGYRWFEAQVGIDDQTGKRGQARISVLVDGKVHQAAANREITAQTPSLDLRIDVRKAKELTLVVDFGDSGDVQAHVNWADARLIREDAR